jgi:regulator of nucleoside diphosphate kinase
LIASPFHWLCPHAGRQPAAIFAPRPPKPGVDFSLAHRIAGLDKLAIHTCFQRSRAVSVSNSCAASQPPRVLTELDHVRIGKWLDAQPQPHAPLRQLLDNADLVASDDVAPDVVTMRSRVRVTDPQGGGDAHDLSLVYPDEADASLGRVSILSPVGTALLGLRVGQVARWQAPGGQSAALRVDAIAYQPEASGEPLR